ncbi:LacI family DNA-binding transcriptional regulator [Vogesella sp. LYT5W]|uniref:LacI family DNA-binding transcriptional regulator n=1 Tax=Vogesella margarita TaxID=2984199 RepID=A0ABT5IR02_9NEIS|nr:LacI family DNA-binding transcriptional regulator [Vogesella margarita]MDC7715005.1 LacI family DNA-binding transcriptional regulator [Vogesella margarita]
MAKIKDVAAAAGVSASTVSRVLCNGPVSDKVRKRVEAAMTRLDYRPNLAARRLRSQHTDTIGLIVSDIRNPFFTAVSRAVEDEAYRNGMRVILCNTDENPDKEAMYLRLMQEERVTGVIFAPTRQLVTSIDQQALGFPVVMIDRVSADAATDAVVLDNRRAAAQLVGHLLQQGYRDIGGLFGNTSNTGMERHAGFSEALQQAGLAAPARFVAPSVEAAEQAVLQWLAEPARPQALLVSNGVLLLGAVRAIKSAGLHWPQDVALVGFDNEVWTDLLGDGLTVMEQPVNEIGRTAMAMLLERLEEPERSQRIVVLQGKLMVRGSSLPQ